MTTLLSVGITTAVTGALSNVYVPTDGPIRDVAIQANFTYGSGGTNATAYVQTSLDGGVTWIDVYAFQATTANLRNVVNLSSATAVTTAYAPTDGTLTANTVKDGILGPLWRVKYTTTGTYAGGTTLRVDIYFNGSLRTMPL